MIKNTKFIKRLASLGLAASIALTAGTAVAEDTELDITLLDGSEETMILTFTGAGLERAGEVSNTFLNGFLAGTPIANISCGADLADLEVNVTFFEPNAFSTFTIEVRPLNYSNPDSTNINDLWDTYYDLETGYPTIAPNPEDFTQLPTVYDVSDHWSEGSTEAVIKFSAASLYGVWSNFISQTTMTGVILFANSDSGASGEGVVLFDDTFGPGCADSSGGLESLLNDLDTAFNNAPLLKKGTLKALANKVEDIQSLACAYEEAEEENCVVDSVVACNRLNALENQVLALYGKQLGQVEGDSILETIYSIALDETLQCDLAN